MNEIIEKYGTIGTVTAGGHEFPLVNIPMI